MILMQTSQQSSHIRCEEEIKTEFSENEGITSPTRVLLDIQNGRVAVLSDKLNEFYEEIKKLRAEIKELEEKIDELESRSMSKSGGGGVSGDVSGLESREMSITAYAPLCDQAVAGWDYSGDPSVTASGEQVRVGETCAAGPSIPFGTKVYIEGLGWYEVNDRGGLIGDNCIDITVSSKAEAQQFGRQNRMVYIKW